MTALARNSCVTSSLIFEVADCSLNWSGRRPTRLSRTTKPRSGLSSGASAGGAGLRGSGSSCGLGISSVSRHSPPTKSRLW